MLNVFHREYAIPWSVLAPTGGRYGLCLVATAILTEVCVELLPERAFFAASAPWAATLGIGVLSVMVALNNPVLAPLARQGWRRFQGSIGTSHANV